MSSKRNTSKSALKALFAASVLLSISAGCSSEGGETLDTHKSQDVTFNTYSTDDRTGAAEASFDGKIRHSSDGTTFYGENHEGERVGLFFPEGTAYQAKGDILEAPTQVEIPINEDVSLGGGYYADPSDGKGSAEFENYFYVSSINGTPLH